MYKRQTRDCGFDTSAIEEFALSGDFDAALREVQRIRAEIDAQVLARAEVEALDAPLAQDPPLAADPLEVCPCCAVSLHTLTTCVAQDETDGGRIGVVVASSSALESFFASPPLPCCCMVL